MELHLRKIGVNVLKLTEVNEDFIKEFAPDEMVLATGANQFVPPIKGVEMKMLYLLGMY